MQYSFCTVDNRCNTLNTICTHNWYRIHKTFNCRKLFHRFSTSLDNSYLTHSFNESIELNFRIMRTLLAEYISQLVDEEEITAVPHQILQCIPLLAQ